MRIEGGAIPARRDVLTRGREARRVGVAMTSYAEGCAGIANRARAAGATEEEIKEAVQVAYLFGGTPALVTAVNAFRT